VNEAEPAKTRIESDKPLTPAMAQYHRWKVAHPDCLLFFRMGDFFELFFDDAKAAAAAIGLTLTSRSKGPDAIPMAGVPVRNVDHYLKKLVALGFRVAICDQIQDPKEAEGVVDRAVIRIVTAGTLTEDDLLDRAQSNWLAAIAPGKGDRCGVALVDVSTGEFRVEECATAEIVEVLTRHAAAEVLVSEQPQHDGLGQTLRAAGFKSITRRPEWEFETAAAREALAEQYRVATLEGFGLDPQSPIVNACGAVLRYITETQKTRLENLATPRLETLSSRLVLDRATRSCLELTETTRENRRDGSLLAVIDHTRTAAGARRLREWLLGPLVELDRIHARQDSIEELATDGPLRQELLALLGNVADIERLLARIVTHRANARDVVALRETLRVVPRLRSTLTSARARGLTAIADRLDPLPELTAHLERALRDDPPLTLRDGGLLRDGYHAELDELRTIHRDGNRFLAEYQERELTRTGIQNLKVGFNQVFGFYIEITNSWKDRVPTDYVRKQTLKNCERYITPELKEYESKVLNAEERANAIEFEQFEAIIAEITAQQGTLKSTASAIADLDAATSLGSVAALHGWTRPLIDDSDVVEIEDGRHPVIAQFLGAANFVPNDCRLGSFQGAAERRFAIVTGPNMAGKSTFIRQIALIQILAQMGSFVPAKSARLGVADRVFARVGASDDLSRGHSTFMVEMTETANILNNATRRSLVVLDEIGRGTSTFDGMALAWAISEHLLLHTRCRSLFATHYHQLIDLAGVHEGVVNLCVTVREWGDEIVFLHRIAEGGLDRSYGIHVARLAGVPREVLNRAASILADLERSAPELRPEQAAARAATPPRKQQGTLFDAIETEVANELRKLDLDRLSPLDALLKMQEWKKRLPPHR
jgi:DNA mismatch repair protein MutS